MNDLEATVQIRITKAVNLIKSIKNGSIRSELCQLLKKNSLQQSVSY